MFSDGCGFHELPADEVQVQPRGDAVDVTLEPINYNHEKLPERVR